MPLLSQVLERNLEQENQRKAKRRERNAKLKQRRREARKKARDADVRESGMRLHAQFTIAKVEATIKLFNDLEHATHTNFQELLEAVSKILGEEATVEAIFENEYALPLKAIFGELCVIETCVVIETGEVEQVKIWWNNGTEHWKQSWEERVVEGRRIRSNAAEDWKDDKPGQAVLQLKKAFLALDPAREDFRKATEALLHEAIAAGIPDDIEPEWREYRLMKRTVKPSELDQLLKSIQLPDEEQAHKNFDVDATVVETGSCLTFLTVYDGPKAYGGVKDVALERRFIGGAKDPVLSVYVEG